MKPLSPSSLVLAGVLCLLSFGAWPEIRVVDDDGNTLVLDGPARRIVSLAPHITETLFAAGAGDKIVATVAHSDYPEAAGRIAIVGSYDRISRESVIAARPDLVIAWGSGNTPEVVESLRALGLNVFVSEPRTLAHIAKNLRDFAALAGRPEQGQAAAGRFNRRLEELRDTFSNGRPVTVFYQVWNEPLLTINDSNLISDVIHLCGGINVFADAIPRYPVVNLETVIGKDPAVIVASGMGEERPDWVENWRSWPGLQAARHSQLYFIPPSLLQRHSTRILDGAQRLCTYLRMARTTQQQTEP